MRFVRHVAWALSAVALSAGLAAGQGATVKEDKPGLLKKAKITADAAIAAAQAKVPKATFKSGEIEEEDGKLIYSLIFETAGKAGVDEVNVNAMTGKVIAVEHEDAKKEAAEEAADKAKAKGKAAPKAAVPPKKP